MKFGNKKRGKERKETEEGRKEVMKKRGYDERKTRKTERRV